MAEKDVQAASTQAASTQHVGTPAAATPAAATTNKTSIAAYLVILFIVFA